MMKTVLFLGDSLTAYCDWEQHFVAHRVFNLGVAGETAHGLLSRLPSVIAAHHSADFVFVMTGINNIAMDDDAVVHVIDSIAGLLCESYPEASICIQSILPVRFNGIDNGKIAGINADLQRVCSARQCKFINIFSLFMDERGNVSEVLFDDDGVHLSDRGYERWVGEIRKIFPDGK